MWRMILPLVACLGLVACDGTRSRLASKRVAFDGVSFLGSARAPDSSDRHAFVATVGPASRSMAGARAAVHHQGVRYCILNFGVSDIDWQVSPEAEVLPMEGDRIVLPGRCLE